MFNRKIKKELKELTEEMERTKKQQLLMNYLSGKECLYDSHSNSLIINYNNQIRVVPFPVKTQFKIISFKYRWVVSSETTFKREQFFTYPVKIETIFLEVVIYYEEHFHQNFKNANRVIYQIEGDNTKIIFSEDINLSKEKEQFYKEVVLEEE